MLGGKTVCLSMIVKNEAHVITRALDSVRGVIDCWSIVDTGSTDGTQAVIWEALAGVPGELLEYPWQDFSTNRTQALLPALRRAEYVLILDADEVVEQAAWFTCPPLDADSYMVEMTLGECRYVARRLLASRLNWSWVGVLHEVPECAGATTNVRLRGFGIRARSEGARSTDPEKFKKDAAVLLAAIAAEPTNDRYRFYLGQTYRDGQMYAEAIKAYQDHLDMVGGWAEEKWYSRLALAWCKQALSLPWPEVLDAYMTAWSEKPNRAEPCFYLAQHYIDMGSIPLADFFLHHAYYKCPAPLTAPLFVDMALYRIYVPWEYAYVCFKMGRHQESLTITNRLLLCGDLPPELHQGLLDNQTTCLAALQEPGRREPEGVEV